MQTVLDFLDDPYRVETDAFVLHRQGNRIVLDRTVFYPGIGISPADTGKIILDDGRVLTVNRGAWHDTMPGVLEHFCDTVPDDLLPGAKVVARIDWSSRFSAMRVHTALHLVSVGFPYPMIDGELLAGWGSATFEADKTGIDARDLENLVETLVRRRLAIEAIWTAQSLRDPRTRVRSFIWPKSQGCIRAIRIADVDLQPCDGLHLRNTEEVGLIKVVDFLRLSAGLYRCDIRVVEDHPAQG
ncbi:alanyl-tRNA editing protein [Neorhizobium lilium]|uniref:Alanyl-tRNA editing protein n=1 Tax=Neorhizobium lilium TaxID=2503024 RepID=A0A3S3VHR5_9HYPH|nr:alanyl-tRNA editing protein [Neorhizobium lilium]RWX74833.1 alanyl-tRNA editing protein [Neorhizobium lilium]